MPLSYGIYLSTLRLWAKRAGLVGSFSTHSLRRGGATFFRHCGATIRQIEDRGDWAGDSIFKYLDVSMADRWSIDTKVASILDLE